MSPDAGNPIVFSNRTHVRSFSRRRRMRDVFGEGLMRVFPVRPGQSLIPRWCKEIAIRHFAPAISCSLRCNRHTNQPLLDRQLMFAHSSTQVPNFGVEVVLAIDKFWSCFRGSTGRVELCGCRSMR